MIMYFNALDLKKKHNNNNEKLKKIKNRYCIC